MGIKGLAKLLSDEAPDVRPRVRCSCLVLAFAWWPSEGSGDQDDDAYNNQLPDRSKPPPSSHSPAFCLLVLLNRHHVNTRARTHTRTRTRQQSIREVELKSLHGRKIAVDASMAIYQFLIAVRAGGPNQQQMQLTNADGETTSHIQGMFNRTIRYLTEGIRVAYVFDGKPPELKSGELGKRREKREKAEEALKVATEEGNVEEQDRQSRRLVRAGTKENDDCRRLLDLMGVPVVQAPCEAEAQAAALAKAGLVYAAATEDMDALTFQTPVLLRKMTFANASKSLIQSVDYQKAVEGLGLTHDEFVDLCILLGCDYWYALVGCWVRVCLAAS